MPSPFEPYLRGGLDTPHIFTKREELHPDGQAVKGACQQKSACSAPSRRFDSRSVLSSEKNLCIVKWHEIGKARVKSAKIQEKSIYNNISSVVEFQRWWVIKSKLFAKNQHAQRKF